MADLFGVDETWGAIRGKLNLNTKRRPLVPSSVVLSHTGTTNHTALLTYSLTAGLIEAGDSLECSFMGECPNNANNKRWRWLLGGLAGDAFMDFTLTTTILIQNVNRLYFPSVSSQVGFNPSNQTGGLGTTTTKFTATKNMAVAQDLMLTMALGSAADTVLLHGYHVDLIKP
jgi:hypothetical protein